MPTSDRPEPTTTTGIQFPPIPEERSVRDFLRKPCDVLTDALVAEFGLDLSSAREDVGDRASDCLIADNGERRLKVNLVDDELLRYTVDPDPEPGTFEVIEVDGFPATRFITNGGCRIVVGIAEEQGFWVIFEPGEGEVDDAVCRKAVAAAEAVLAKLPTA
ncbi:DUF3558 family protein [Actinokineospora soli]|uniref:DUF3558 family protein n=1 Tax=Actinokineospora soli TaxID=1048753 RepID=A0ABW2TKS4_9PSEU